jgi:fructuronate reductase
MIDKITPRPSEKIQDYLDGLGFENTEMVCTAKKTYIAPFINAEASEYLVIEDQFPNGRPPLERAGVIFTDRETVENAERMKVTTCLNPLHTALAVYGCLLGYETIADEMRDPQLKKLVEKVGYTEGMPVVIDPGIISPGEFIRDAIENRFSNPYIPDTPQRIATDTSQKLAIRFGETIKSYCERPELDVKTLVYIPLVLAGWFRYLLAVDDNGEKMTLSADPMMEQLRQMMAGIELGKPETADGKLKAALSNPKLFGVDLYEIGLGEKIEGYFKELISGRQTVRKTLVKYLG